MKEPEARMALSTSGFFTLLQAFTCKCHGRTRRRAKERTAGRPASDPLWPSVRHVVDSLLRTLRSSWNFITFCRRHLYASAFSFPQTVVAKLTMLLFASLNNSVGVTRSQAPFKCAASMENTCPFSSPQKDPQLKPKFRKGIAVGLCLVGTGAFIQKQVDATNFTFNSPE